MKKLKCVLLSSLALLLFTGCADDQPSFNPNNKGFVVIEGKVYRIPLQASYSTQAFKSEKDKGILKLRQSGVDCRKGDISWVSSEMQMAAQTAASSGDVNLASSIVMAAPRKGQIGCAHPLSKKEYEYYRGKQ